MDAAIQIRGLKKTFDGGKSFILKGIDLDIPKGKITMIIGFSGTGKSVLLKHILGLMQPTAGDVSVLGRHLSEMSGEEVIQLRTTMGMLFQHAALFDDMTVLENVCFPIREHRRHLSNNVIIDIAWKKLLQSGMTEEHFEKLPAELSGGMRKRVGLARALALDPEILMYDEPTTGLDPILTEMVDNLILETHRMHKGKTSLIISHDLTSAFRLGEYIVMLDKGKVLLEGTPEVFMNSDNEFVRKFVDKGIKRKG